MPQQLEIKNNFNGGLDMDTSYYALPHNAYVDAKNISKNAQVNSQDQVITNIVGNQVVNYSLPAGTNKVIGKFAWFPYLYYFVYNSNNHHSILEYNNTTRVISKVFESLADSATDILNFTAFDKINSVNIYESVDGRLMFFLDCLGRPTGLNIARFKAGQYTPVTRNIIDVIKVPPLVPIVNTYGNDTSAGRRSNNLTNKLFRFKYRFVYDDNEKSVTSPIGKVPLPVNVLDDTYTSVITNNNIINLTLTSGDKNVKAVELLMSFVDKTNSWSDFALVETINKADNSIGNNTTFSYVFSNDSTYPYIPVTESILLYDYVPDFAGAQDMANGNVLIYGDVSEGLSRTITPNVTLSVLTSAVGTSGSIGSLAAASSFRNQSGQYYVNGYQFSGKPATGTKVSLKIRRRSDGAEFPPNTNPPYPPISYTTIDVDTADSVSYGLQAAVNAAGFPSFTLNAIHHNSNDVWIYLLRQAWEEIPSLNDPTYWTQLTITPPATTLAANSTPTWKWSTSRNIGLTYFNSQGKTNGVLYNAKVTFPAYAETSGQPLLPYINVKINHLPPTWATSFQFVATKEPTNYVFLATSGINTSETDYIYLDITGLTNNAAKFPATSQVLSYSFKEGDRLRLIKNLAPVGTVYADTYDATVLGLLTNPKINGTEVKGTFIKIKKVAPFDTVFGSYQNFVIELYSTGQSTSNKENQAYFEIGRQYPTMLDANSVLVHGGEVTNQSTVGLGTPAEFNLTEGDSYYRQRTMVTTQLTFDGFATFNIQDRNFVDIYPSAVSSLDGRASVIDKNAKPVQYGAMVRFGQAFQANTNINGLSRFYPNDFQDCDYGYGDIKMLRARDRHIRVFQELKVGQIPLYSEISKDRNGNSNLVVTDKLLNDVNYYVGNNGIGSASESLASSRYSDYFIDNYKGDICRVSDDGVTVLSTLYKMNAWANAHIPSRTGNYKIYGAYDEQLDNYIMAFEATGSDSAYTLSFNERNNTFESFLSYLPEMMVNLSNLFITFKNGNLYTHDNIGAYNTFYGVAYDSMIKIVFNQNAAQIKDFKALDQRASIAWNCPEILTSINSFGTTQQQSNLLGSDFTLIEGRWCSSFYQDVNSAVASPLINGDDLRGNYISIKFVATTPTTLVNLNQVLLRSVDSAMN